MPVTTRSQAAAATQRRGSSGARDLGPRRGIPARRRHALAAAAPREDAAPPEATARSTSSCRAGVVLAGPAAPRGEESAVGDAMSRSAKESAPGVRGEEKDVEGVGSVSGSSCANNALVREMQMRVKTLEAEIERMKQERGSVAAPAEAESRAASRVRLRMDAAPASCAVGERHISSLGDDILLEIFLRLPSLATLVRVACTCPAWRRLVASSPDFRRRFGALHPLPLLGFFADMSAVLDLPVFIPARLHDPDLTAAVRGGNFLLTSLVDRHKETTQWLIMGCNCRCGYVLIINPKHNLLAVLNPLTRQRQSERALDLDLDNIFRSFQGYCAILLSLEVDPLSFRVVFVGHVGSTLKAVIFSMDTGVCSATVCVDVPARPEPDDNVGGLSETIVQLNGFMYYLLENWRYIVSLDTVTMKFSIAELPQCLSYSFEVGETKDGTICIIYTDGLNVGVLMHTRDADGVEKWVLDRVVSMDAELERVLPGQFDERCVLNVLAVRDGYAYLRTSETLHGPKGRGWFLSLCIETMKLEKLFRSTLDYSEFPYIMPWPRSLVGNYGKFALKVEGASLHPLA